MPKTTTARHSAGAQPDALAGGEADAERDRPENRNRAESTRNGGQYSTTIRDEVKAELQIMAKAIPAPSARQSSAATLPPQSRLASRLRARQAPPPLPAAAPAHPSFRGRRGRPRSARARRPSPGLPNLSSMMSVSTFTFIGIGSAGGGRTT